MDVFDIVVYHVTVRSRVYLEPVADLVVYESGACAVLKSGLVRCWGEVPGLEAAEPTAVVGSRVR